MKSSSKNRRSFIKSSGAITAGVLLLPFSGSSQTTSDSQSSDLYMIGPKEGYSPRVGTLLSTMTMMRAWIVRQVAGLTKEQLDFQLDDKSNSIGAMLYHLAATEKYYQLNTFDNTSWGEWDKKVAKEWDVAMNLGEIGREKIKGNDIDFYLDKLSAVRKVTEEEFAKRDDEWLDVSEPFFGNEPTNNHCKWFHVCEHESNHNGQIKFIKARFTV
ncbi:MAG: DinB family protein [Ekhidna sp.]